MAKFKLNKKLRNFLIAAGAIILVFLIASLLPDKDFHEKYEGQDLSATTIKTSSALTYSEYLAAYPSAKNASSTVDVDIFAFDEAESEGVHAESAYHGKDVVFTDDLSSVTWYVDVPEAGFYNLELEYIATPSRNVNMERILYINDKVPFSGADVLNFFRLWKDGSEVAKDNQGNDIRPTQVEVFDYQTARFKSDLGYEIDPYRFYFEAGTNKITFESTSEPMAISRFSLVPAVKYDTYEQYVAKQRSKPENFTSTLEESIIVQGEESIVRSDPSLFARYDRSSATTVPYSVKNTILNYTGGESWKSPGQWIDWEFEVPEDGWYKISIKGRQLYQRGYVACRSVYIDGEIPFEEVKSIGFPYSTDWNLLTLSDPDGNPYKFYLKHGKHKIRLEATLGEIGSIISSLQDSITRLNTIYRTILVLTGKNPDPYRDYEIDKVYPDEVEGMIQESRRLYKLIDEFVRVNGEKSDKIAPAETLAIQLEQFYARPDKITKAFGRFKENITSLGSSLLSLAETKLDIDYIAVQSVNDKKLKDKSNFFKDIKHEVVSFVTSFFVNSENLGNVYDENSEHLIEVWILTGRAQSQILKNMVDDTFSPTTGINVNVKLINANSLLNAVVAGNGPDVVISTGGNVPVDYALRNADVDLTRFDDCEEVLKRFYPSAYECYRYNGGVYALPETESFNLLFYRKDILEELGLEVPKTWNDLIEILPTLQGKNLDVAIPFPQLAMPDVSAFYSMIYQNGGRIYNEGGTKSLIDSEEGISAFKTYTAFFNSYGLPTYYDFLSRFRIGEMPLGIANYTTYSTLTVSAPEIRGLWDFTYILGTEREDENGNAYIDRSTIASSACTMMIKKGLDLSDFDTTGMKELVYSNMAGKTYEEGVIPGVDKRQWEQVMKNERRMADSWEFMKWWTSADAQLRFGREQEALLGSSARYATANVEALKQLSWNSKQISVLVNSLEESVGVPEVPGGYYTPRHLVNGSRKVINDKDDPRETLIDYTRKINEELTRKRQEFNLPVEED